MRESFLYPRGSMMHRGIHRRASWWRIFLCGALILVGCGDNAPSGPSRRVAYSELNGVWGLEVRDTAGCAALAEPVVITLTIKQQSGDTGVTLLFLMGNRSQWSASGFSSQPCGLQLRGSHT